MTIFDLPSGYYRQLRRQNIYTSKHIALVLLTTLLGISSMIGSSTKFHYLLNRIWVMSSYVPWHRRRRNLICQVNSHPLRTMYQLPVHDRCVFRYATLAKLIGTMCWCLVRIFHGIHITEIQAVLCNFNPSVPRPVRMCDDMWKHEHIKDATKFINSIIPATEYHDITAYVTLFVGVFYCSQNRICTLEENMWTSEVMLVCSMFSGFRNDTEIQYVDLIYENAAQERAIHESIEVIYKLYRHRWTSQYFGRRLYTFTSFLQSFFDRWLWLPALPENSQSEHLRKTNSHTSRCSSDYHPCSNKWQSIKFTIARYYNLTWYIHKGFGLSVILRAW